MASRQLAEAAQKLEAMTCGNLIKNEAGYRGMASKHSKIGGGLGVEGG
jgi:hypothetical protein